MTTAEKLSMVRTMLRISDESEDDLITVYLNFAKHEILSWRYSYCSDEESIPTDVPSEYEATQVAAVIAGYSQSGAENQTVHHENGINRHFVYADMVAYIRANVIPIAKVIKA